MRGYRAFIARRFVAIAVAGAAACAALAGPGFAAWAAPAAPRARAARTVPSTWLEVSAGTYFTCAVATDHGLWCWGEDNVYQLGAGDSSGRNRYSPVRVGTRADWSQVTAGGAHACAIRSGGTLWCWGDDSFGQLGIGPATSQKSPVRLGGSRWAAVAAGDDHTCAITTAGTLWCWGDNAYGQLGIGASAPSSDVPVQVGTAANWAQVSAGGQDTCAVTTAGRLWCWGFNGTGRLGIGSTASARRPVRVGSAADWAQVSAGYEHTCAVTTAGTLWCWGAGGDGQLGIGQPEFDRVAPVRVGSGTDWTAVSAGDSFTCAVHADPSLECWGSGGWGQLGLGEPVVASYAPAYVRPQGGWWRVSAGADHACAITGGRTLWCWGDGIDGQLGTPVPSGGQSDAPIQVG